MAEITEYDYAQIGAKIREARRKLGWSQECLAEKADISPAFVGHIERGTRIMSLETFIKICRALDLSPDYVLFDTLPPSDPILLNIFHSVKQKNTTAYSKFLKIVKAIATISDEL